MLEISLQGCNENDYLISRYSKPEMIRKNQIFYEDTNFIYKKRMCDYEAEMMLNDSTIESIELDYVGIVSKIGERKLYNPDEDMGPPTLALGVTKSPTNIRIVEPPTNFPTFSPTLELENWGLSRIDQANLPLSGFYNPDYSGNGTCIYILDTGLRVTHSEFINLNVTLGKSFTSNTVEDIDGHGTHCSSIAAGIKFGVAKKVTLIPVKVLNDEGTGTWGDIIKGVEWAATEKEQCPSTRKIISMSLGGPENKALNKIVKLHDNVVIVVAAGNNPRVVSCKQSPSGAKGKHIITVAGTTIFDWIWPYSSVGSCIDIFAPASEISAASSENDYAISTFSGTSTATPIVAGVASMIWEKYPYASAREVKNKLLDIGILNVITNIQNKRTPNILVNTPRINQASPRTRSIHSLDYITRISGKKIHTKKALFGPQKLFSKGELVIADPFLACGKYPKDIVELVNKKNISGKIAIVKRGECLFTSKIKACQSAGSIGVIVINNIGGLEEMGFNFPNNLGIDIPSIMIKRTEGRRILNKLHDGNIIEIYQEINQICRVVFKNRKNRKKCNLGNLPGFHDAYCKWNGRFCATLQI